jgi:hypothetical protein
MSEKTPSGFRDDPLVMNEIECIHCGAVVAEHMVPPPGTCAESTHERPEHEWEVVDGGDD